MDPITSVDASQELSGLTQASSTTLDRDDFLQLLVTQLSNQDPLNPMDGQEFAAQLAQFSSLEQLIDINDNLIQSGEINGLLAQSINSGVAADLIGKTIESEGNQFYFDGSEETSLKFDLSNVASDIEVEILNPAGQSVRTISLSQLQSGDHEVTWDGKDADGNDLAAGDYTFNVKATNVSGEDVHATTYISGVVERVTYNQNGIFLWIGNTSINMGNVRSVSENE